MERGFGFAGFGAGPFFWIAAVFVAVAVFGATAVFVVTAVFGVTAGVVAAATVAGCLGSACSRELKLDQRIRLKHKPRPIFNNNGASLLIINPP